MDSIAKNEFIVIDFLVRNFSERLTIRNIAAKLELSAAGVHAILKKLEKADVLNAEKLGTGLFYRIDFSSKIARHLAAIVLLKKEADVPELEKLEGKAAVLYGKKVLLVTGMASVNSLEDFELISLSKEELIEKLKSRDRGIIEIIKEGVVVFGEDCIIDVIKEVTRF